MRSRPRGSWAIVGLLLLAIVAVVAGKRQPGGTFNHTGPSPRVTGSAQSVAPLPRLLELGSTSCVPCKMMAPILDELRVAYRGRLRVDFVDVWKEAGASDRYHIEAIPTQIFFDASGKEQFRHTGYYPKAEIEAKLKELGVAR